MALSRVVRLMCREVTPPFAVVVPEVMVLVLPVDPDRQFCFFHMRYSFRSNASGPGTKKPPSLASGWWLTSHGDIMFKTHSGLAHLQQQMAVDQSTLASPGQVAAPSRGAPDARGRA